MTTEIIGRDGELGSVHAFLDRDVDGLSALVLEGQAGIGKSTLWLAGVSAARGLGFRVLSSRPAEAERGLAHAGLGDLFENVLDIVLPALSAPRRHALEAALLVEESPRGSDPRTLGVAVRSALEALAADEPVVLAIDDVQWLDRSSASSLAFALRRLCEQSVLLLLARRVGEEAAPPELERAVDADRVERLSVGPLSLGATHRLLQARLGQTFSRPKLLRVHDVSGGNPFYALELARVLLSGEDDPMQPLHVPETLEALVRARLEGLPPITRDALLLVSAMGRPSAELLASAGVAQDELELAFTAHVLERPDGTIRFTHPLLASVVYQSASEDERRRAHERVATIVKDPLDRARHLALSTQSPDPGIAAAVEDAAALANARGAPIAAAELAEHALRLTPTDALDDHHRRVVAVARAQLASGEVGRAHALAEDLLAVAPPGRKRAEALILLAEIATERDKHLLLEALREAADHPALRSLIHQRLGWALIFTEGLRAAELHARASLELAEQLDDDALRAGALARSRPFASTLASPTLSGSPRRPTSWPGLPSTLCSCYGRACTWRARFSGRPSSTGHGPSWRRSTRSGTSATRSRLGSSCGAAAWSSSLQADLPRGRLCRARARDLCPVRAPRQRVGAFHLGGRARRCAPRRPRPRP